MEGGICSMPAIKFPFLAARHCRRRSFQAPLASVRGFNPISFQNRPTIIGDLRIQRVGYRPLLIARIGLVAAFAPCERLRVSIDLSRTVPDLGAGVAPGSAEDIKTLPLGVRIVGAFENFGRRDMAIGGEKVTTIVLHGRLASDERAWRSSWRVKRTLIHPTRIRI
jgi:hypothetical protein